MNRAQTTKSGERTQLFLADDRKRKAACFRIANEDGIVVADVYQNDLATVFLAAPELLEACKDALAETVDERVYPDGPCLPKETRDALRFAIAKAEGQS